MLCISEIFVCEKVRFYKIEFHASHTMDLDPAHWDDYFKHIKPYHYPGGCRDLTLGQKRQGWPCGLPVAVPAATTIAATATTAAAAATVSSTTSLAYSRLLFVLPAIAVTAVAFVASAAAAAAAATVVVIIVVIIVIVAIIVVVVIVVVIVVFVLVAIAPWNKTSHMLICSI